MEIVILHFKKGCLKFYPFLKFDKFCFKVKILLLVYSVPNFSSIGISELCFFVALTYGPHKIYT